MIRINEIKLSLDDSEDLLKKKTAKTLKINEKYIDTKRALMQEKRMTFISHTALMLKYHLTKTKLYQNASRTRYSL